MEAKGKISDRCQINRDIRKINRLMKEVTYIAKEITKLITEKLEELYGRVRRVTTALANSKNAGRDDITYGRTGTVNRKSREGNSGIVRATGRITAIKRGVAETEQNITATAERIKEIKQLISEKEAIRDARIRRIMERRETSRGAGRTARGNRDTSGTRNQLCESDNAFRTGTEKSSDSIRTNPEAIVRRESEIIRERGDDIEAFIKYLNAKERVSEQERENREAERSGFGTKGKCEAEKPKRRIIEKKR